MSIIRIAKRTNPFVMIDKSCLDDPRLSLKAKGLLAYLLSRPDNWSPKVSHLIKQSTDGRDSVYAALKELREYKYCYRKQIREGGKFAGYEYTIYETSEIPFTEKPYTDKPYTENPTLNNIESNKKDLNKEEEEATAALTKLYHDNLGMITPIAAEWISDAVTEYPASWFEPAFEEAVKNNVRTWNYISSILERWKSEGFKTDGRKKKSFKLERDYEGAAKEWLELRKERSNAG